MNSRHVGGHSLETHSHPIDMIVMNCTWKLLLLFKDAQLKAHIRFSYTVYVSLRALSSLQSDEEEIAFQRYEFFVDVLC
jgi:hypothetical protein